MPAHLVHVPVPSWPAVASACCCSCFSEFDWANPPVSNSLLMTVFAYDVLSGSVGSGLEVPFVGPISFAVSMVVVDLTLSGIPVKVRAWSGESADWLGTDGFAYYYSFTMSCVLGHPGAFGDGALPELYWHSSCERPGGDCNSSEYIGSRMSFVDTGFPGKKIYWSSGSQFFPAALEFTRTLGSAGGGFSSLRFDGFLTEAVVDP